MSQKKKRRFEKFPRTRGGVEGENQIKKIRTIFPKKLGKCLQNIQGKLFQFVFSSHTLEITCLVYKSTTFLDTHISRTYLPIKDAQEEVRGCALGKTKRQRNQKIKDPGMKVPAKSTKGNSRITVPHHAQCNLCTLKGTEDSGLLKAIIFTDAQSIYPLDKMRNEGVHDHSMSQNEQ